MGSTKRMTMSLEHASLGGIDLRLDLVDQLVFLGTCARLDAGIVPADVGAVGHVGCWGGGGE